jgi:hypothetical protein
MVDEINTENNEELPSEVVDYTKLLDTDEHGTEWVEVNYTYECPKDNYCDGEETETIEMVYRGPKELYLWIRKPTGEIQHVQRKWEYELAIDNDLPEPDPEEEIIVVLDATKDPLAAEVLSDYHDNYKDPDEYEETVPLKYIPVAEGYEAFCYPYPIHPDELYDDKKSVYNFETGEIDLYKNSTVDIVGEASTWEQLREDRNAKLEATDTLWLILKDVDPERWAKFDKYRQLLRDFPAMIEEYNIPLILADSCFPQHPDVITPEMEGRTSEFHPIDDGS